MPIKKKINFFFKYVKGTVVLTVCFVWQASEACQEKKERKKGKKKIQIKVFHHFVSNLENKPVSDSYRGRISQQSVVKCHSSAVAYRGFLGVQPRVVRVRVFCLFVFVCFCLCLFVVVVVFVFLFFFPSLLLVGNSQP